MGLVEDIKDWSEMLTGAVSVEYRPKEFSCDNGVLFSAELVALLPRTVSTVQWFENLCKRYESEPGCLLRYPHSVRYMSWDDHTGAAAVSSIMAQRIYEYGSTHGWTWPDGNNLGRFPLMVATVKANSVKLNLWDKITGALCYIYNCFEPKEETSGKIILWLASRVLYDKSWILKLSIKIWRWRMYNKYPQGLNEILNIYFRPRQNEKGEWVAHPFCRFSGTSLE